MSNFIFRCCHCKNYENRECWETKLLVDPIQLACNDIQRTDESLKEEDKFIITDLRAKLESEQEISKGLTERLKPEITFSRATDRIDELEAKLEAAEKENEIFKCQIYSADKERDEARQQLNETYTDEGGTIWYHPTAWAYYAVCNARDKWQSHAEEFQRLYGNAIKLANDFDKRREEEMYKRIDLEKQVEGLQAQVAVLREALASVGDTLGSCLDNNSIDVSGWLDLAKGEIDKALSTTSAEAAERVQGLVDALKEAKRLLVLSGTTYVDTGDYFREQYSCVKKIKETLAKYRGEVGE